MKISCNQGSSVGVEKLIGNPERLKCGPWIKKAKRAKLASCD